MKRRQVYYYSNMTPFAAIGFALLALGAFFLTLPILIAAFTVFAAVGAYISWRITKTIKKAEEEMLKRREQMRQAQGEDHLIIDITPDSEDKNLLEDGRS